MRASNDPLVQERRSRMYSHPASQIRREALRPKVETPESQLRQRHADEKSALIDKHRGEFDKLARAQDRENVAQHRQGVQFPTTANADRHARARRELQEKHQHEREQLAERHREEQRQRLRAERRD